MNNEPCEQYCQRDIEKLDQAGRYYINHVSAMTAEKLDSKSAIAAELGYRDYIVAKQRDLIEQLEKQNSGMRKEIHFLETRLKKAREQNAVLREALEESQRYIREDKRGCFCQKAERPCFCWKDEAINNVDEALKAAGSDE